MLDIVGVGGDDVTVVLCCVVLLWWIGQIGMVMGEMVCISCSL